jgi:hypothetical protein
MAEISHKVNSLSVSNINIINKPEDPRIFGYSSSIGSLYFRDNGEIYQKFSSENLDWELLFPKETKNITADYDILRTNCNLTIDSTSGNINLNLPDVSALYKGKEYFFKKTSTSNIVTINPFSGQTIDGDNSKTLTLLNDSIILIYIDSNNWTTKSSSNNSNATNSNEKTEITVTQNSHGFSFGNLVRFSSSWQKARANVLTNYSLGIVSEVVDSNTFKICLSGYLSGFIGLTSNTLYYLSETSIGDYTDVKSDILKQPVFFSISTTEAIVLQWSPSFIDLLQNNEYVVSNNGVLSFTDKSGFYKLIEKNNVLNEIDIKYSIGNSYVTLIVKNMSSLFSDIKDTTSKVNIYVESTTIKVQNLSGLMKTFIIKKII